MYPEHLFHRNNHQGCWLRLNRHYFVPIQVKTIQYINPQIGIFQINLNNNFTIAL